MLTPKEIAADIRWHEQMRKQYMAMPAADFDDWVSRTVAWHTETIKMLKQMLMVTA